MDHPFAIPIISVASSLAAGIYDNHFWRILVLLANRYAWATFVDESSWLLTAAYFATMASIWNMPMFANLTWNKRKGCVFITGCDSGMGQATVLYLAQTNQTKNGGSYSQIFAACFNPKASREYFNKHLTSEQQKMVTVVPLDVTNPSSVEEAKKTIESYLETNRKDSDPATQVGLTGICMYHGIAFNGPAPYMPVEMYERQLQVNFLGFVRVTQAMLPLLKKRHINKKQKSIPARLIFTGTGGGPCTPCPPLLTAYMSSKFATEAFCQSLRQELSMTETGIEALMINPGFVKPTMLMEEGKKLTDKMWKVCEERLGTSIAKDEFGPLMDHFIEYSALQPGTHVTEVCKAAEHGLLAPVPRTSYKVGIDSKVAPIVGMLPTGVREAIARHGIYGILSPAGTIKGYKV